MLQATTHFPTFAKSRGLAYFFCNSQHNVSLRDKLPRIGDADTVSSATCHATALGLRYKLPKKSLRVTAPFWKVYDGNIVLCLIYSISVETETGTRWWPTHLVRPSEHAISGLYLGDGTSTFLWERSFMDVTSVRCFWWFCYEYQTEFKWNLWWPEKTAYISRGRHLSPRKTTSE